MRDLALGNDAVRLSYEPRHDIINNIAPLSEDEMNWVPPDQIMVERYVRLETEIQIDVSIDVGLGDQRLVFRGIPEGRVKGVAEPCRLKNSSEVEGIWDDPNRQGQLMLMGARNAPYVSQSVVASGIALPSWVWLKGPQDRMDLRRNVFGLPSNFSCQNVVKIRRVLPKREMSSFALSGSTKGNIDPLGAMKDALIKRVPQRLDCICRNTPQFPRDRIGKNNLVNLLHSLLIEIDDKGISCVRVKKGFASLTKVLGFRLCPTD